MRRLAPMLPVWIAALAAACGDAPAPPPIARDGPRIVTVTPALTRMVVDLGLAGSIVGIGENDDAAPASLDAPVVGTFVDVDLERLAATRPTHVLMMSGRAGPPANVAAMADTLGFDLLAYPYPRTVADVAAVLHDADDSLTTPSVGEALGVAGRAAELRRVLTEGLDAIAGVTSGRPRPRVLLVFGEGVPVMAIGPGAPLDELLRVAGGDNAASATGVPAPTFDREKLAALSPEVVVVLQPEGRPLGELASDRRLAPFRGMPIPAVSGERFYLINHPEALLPATRMLDVAAELAACVHPGLAAEVADAVESVRSGG